ncbi:MAG TPA: RNA methyltransferase [Actinomycetota bacterium]|jgi:TrmH family RNA methyltransferase
MLITSTSNALVKRIRSLRRRRDRAREGAFFVEGIQPVWHALDHGAMVEKLIVAPDVLTSEPARTRVDDARSAGVDVATVSPEVFAALSERDGPSGLGAVIEIRSRALSDLDVSADGIVIALEAVGNPGNLGTILRSADGAGATAVVVVGDAADPYDPGAVKASMGALFTVPVLEVADLGELVAWARSSGLTIVTTSARAPTLYSEAAYRLPALVVLGSEGDGLSTDALSLGDLQVRIDMRGAVSSLNLAVAAGILLYEMRRVTST